jgi:hypothetical protein
MDAILPPPLCFSGGSPRGRSENFEQLGLCRQDDLLLQSLRRSRSIFILSGNSPTHETERLAPEQTP